MVAIAFAAAGVLFSPNLLHSWAGQPSSTVGAGDYLQLAGFAASLSIFIGALGGSFERHKRMIKYASRVGRTPC